MRTRSEYLIQKRDGRLQHLRATRLARSLRLALRGPAAECGSGGVVGSGADSSADQPSDGDLLACELATAILKAIGAVQERARVRGQGGCAGTSAPSHRITTRQLAEVAVGALQQCGRPDAAERYLAHRALVATRALDRRMLRFERSSTAHDAFPIERPAHDGLTAPDGVPRGRR